MRLQLELFMISVSGCMECVKYMEATAACRGISLIYYTLQCYITYTYISWCSAFDLYLKCGTYAVEQVFKSLEPGLYFSFSCSYSFSGV